MSGEGNKTEQFDTLFLSIAQHHPQGATQLLDTFVNFLSRKTDFFIGGREGEWEKLVMSTFRKYEKLSKEQHEADLKEKREKEAKSKAAAARKAEAEAIKSAELTELTDAEAEKLQAELDAKNKPTNSSLPDSPSPSVEKVEDDEDESEKGKLIPNKGNGCDLDKYKWTQTLGDIEVMLILGMAGGLRREEIYNICMKDMKEDSDKNTLHISIPKTKNGNAKSFLIMGELREIIRKYQQLRPADAKTEKFLINYQRGKCCNQVIGINKVGTIPKKIAVFLGKENADAYSGHSFRRTSATLLVDAGADITELKRHGGWKSTAVAEGYLGDSINNKKRTYSKITESINIEATKKKSALANHPITSQPPSRSAASTSTSNITALPGNENVPPPEDKKAGYIYNLHNCTVNIVHNDK